MALERLTVDLQKLERRVERLETLDSPTSVAAVAAGGAPVGAQYVVMAYNGALTQERLLQATAILTVTDGGANNPVTLAIGDYARGSVIRGGAAEWEDLTIGVGGSVLFSDGTDAAWADATLVTPFAPGAQGDMIIANAIPAWEALNIGAQFTHLESSGVTAAWQVNLTLADDAWIGLGGGAGRLVFDSTPAPDQVEITTADLNFVTAAHGIIHVDGVSAGPPRQLLLANGTRYVPGTLAATDLPAHSILSNQHGDTNPQAVSRGSIIYGNAGPFWDELIHPGAAGYAFTTTATDVAWDLTPNWLGDHTWTSATAQKPVLTIENTNADSAAPTIDFYKNTASPDDGDDLGAIDFFGETSTGAKERYAFMVAESLDVTNGDTGGGIRFTVVMDAAERNLFEISGYNGAVDQGEVIVNQAGEDVDFRVEGVGAANALVVQGSDGFVGVGTNAPSTPLEVQSSGTEIIELEKTGAGARRWQFQITTGGFFQINDRSAPRDVITLDISGNVGIGTAGPAAVLDVNGNGNFLSADNAIVGTSTGANKAGVKGEDNNNAGNGVFGTSSGTGGVGVWGNIAVGGTGASIAVYGVQNGSGWAAQFIGGDVGINTAIVPDANGGACIIFDDNTADLDPGNNTAGLFAKDVAGTVEMFAVDEAGNAAQLTPHNFTLFDPDPSYGYPWSYYASNKFLGKEINVDLYGAIKAIEALTGGQFIFERDIPKHAWTKEKAPPDWMLERMRDE